MTTSSMVQGLATPVQSHEGMGGLLSREQAWDKVQGAFRLDCSSFLCYLCTGRLLSFCSAKQARFLTSKSARHLANVCQDSSLTLCFLTLGSCLLGMDLAPA